MTLELKKPGPALFALAMGGFCIGTTEFASMGLLPQISTSLQVSIPTAGYVIAAYAVGVVLGAPLITAIAARMERRLLLVLLMAAFVVGNVLSALAPSLHWLILGRLLAGLPHGAFFGVGGVVGATVAGPGKRGRAVSMMMAGLTISNIVGVPLSTLVGQHLGWRSAFVSVGVLGVLTLLALFRWIPVLPTHPDTTMRSELSALKRPQVWLALGAGSIGFGGMFAVYSYVAPTMIEVAKLDGSAVPIILMIFGVGMTLGSLLGGRWADRSVLGTIYLGFGTMTVVLILFALTAAWVMTAAFGIFLIGVTSQILSPALQSRLMDVSPRAPSLAAALCHSALNIGNAAGAWLGGLVIAIGWGYLAPAWVGAFLSVIGLGIALISGALDKRVKAGTIDSVPDSSV